MGTVRSYPVSTIAAVVVIVIAMVGAMVASMWAPGGATANDSLLIALLGFIGTVVTSLLTLVRVENLSNTVKQQTAQNPPPPTDNQGGPK